MKLFITFTRKSLAITLAATIIIVILSAQVFTIKSTGIDGSTNARRVEYIESLGYSIDDSNVLSKNIVIPQEFSAVYKKYNALQMQSGFDLSLYKGCNATVYTYCIVGADDMRVNIIVSDGYVIGGDVSSVRIDGEMTPLISVK